MARKPDPERIYQARRKRLGRFDRMDRGATGAARMRTRLDRLVESNSRPEWRRMSTVYRVSLVATGATMVIAAAIIAAHVLPR
jgi:hypothetical protein